MGNLFKDKKRMSFKDLLENRQRPFIGAALLVSWQVNQIFRIHQTRNKSGARLLTTFVLKTRRDNEHFTKRRAKSAVRDGNGYIGEACLKHPAFNGRQASP
jgi:hypothetical protein